MARNDLVADVKDAGDKKGLTNPFSADEAKVSTSIRFWSTQSGYKIASAPGKNATFKNHVLVLESSDPVAKAIRGARSPYIKEVLSVPFTNDNDLARFNKFLQGLVYRNDDGRPSKRGMIALTGIFSPDDKLDPSLTPDGVIMRALKTKSFKEGI